MRTRKITATIFGALLLAIGCGGDACGGGCMAPVPGGFPPDLRESNAISVKLSKDGLDAIETLVADLVVDMLGASGFDVPCSKMTQTVGGTIPGLGYQGVTANIFICDLDESGACSAADDTHSSRASEMACRATMSVDGIDVLPVQNVSGSVDVEVTIQLRVTTGKIPIKTDKLPLFNCTVGCSASFDTTLKTPEYLPVVATLRLKVDPNNHDILSFDVPDLADITEAIDSDELKIKKESNNCSWLNWGCDALNFDLVKSLIFSQLQGMIADTLTDAVNGFRCLACESGTNACPSGATCEDGLCYETKNNVKACVPNLLGLEGRTNLGELLADFGGTDANLDVSIVAGGRNADGKPSTLAQTGGLVLGMLGGTRAADPAICVPIKSFTMPPLPAAMDFDAEVNLPAAGGSSVAGYHVGIGLSSRFLDKTMHDLWQAGGLCLNLGTEQVEMVSSALFGTFISSLGLLTQGQNVPMLLALRPFQAPRVKIGRGTVKQGPKGMIPDDPLLTIEIPDLHIDFYALIEGRQARLFTLATDVTLPLSLEFDALAGTVTPVLGALDALLQNSRGINSEMLAEDAQELVKVIDSVIGLVQPMLGDALGPIALPEIQGFQLQVLDARGSVKKASSGYEHLALFANLASGASPYSTRFDAHARLVSVAIPDVEALRAGAKPSVVIDASGTGVQPRGFAGLEYSWRVDDGFWRPWTTESRLVIEPAVLRLQGRHSVDVRVRERGIVESTGLTPARVWFDVDWEAPVVSLVLDRETGEVVTKANDWVTPADELSYRYRVGGESWSASGGIQAFALADLGEDPLLEVEVTDAMGLSSVARFGGVATEQPVSPLSKNAAGSQGGGCATGAVGLLALVGLVGAMRRRRR